MQDTFDKLYEKSKKNKPLNGLYEKIISDNNIKLAYRTVKTNKGSTTSGVDGLSIKDIKTINIEKLIDIVKNKLKNYQPNKVKRVFISKSDGKKRPLGIPTMIDRIIQQMFKQILEPICEAKFYNHSYGFRPNRNTSHALGRFETLAGRHSFHYVVDIDIKGFFDNINHTKLIEQMWTLGIRDKRVLKLVKKMLKAEIDGEGIPTKGTPQGGILSPLLANIVLNELDQWVYSQWENFKTHKKYSTKDYRMAKLKKCSKLKQGFLIRYADDFKIMCKNYNDAKKWFYAVKDFLEKRLKLEISENKSKITNLKKKHSEFLGIKIRVEKSSNKFVTKSKLSDKAKKNILRKLKHKIVRVKQIQTRKEVHNLNSTILGMQNYYSLATKVNLEFSDIAFKLSKSLRHQLKKVGEYGYPSDANDSYKRNYKGYRMKTYKVCGLWIFPIAGVRHKCKYNFTQSICNYTEIGRSKIHNKLNYVTELQKFMNSYLGDRSIEYNDNRISRYSMQQGKCAISKTFLYAHEAHCHHVRAVKDGGSDDFDNLSIVHKDIHVALHSTDIHKIKEVIKLFDVSKDGIRKFNKYRKELGLEVI